jgi:peptidoglycan hydrolase CwlO-like protein
MTNTFQRRAMAILATLCFALAAPLHAAPTDSKGHSKDPSLHKLKEKKENLKQRQAALKEKIQDKKERIEDERPAIHRAIAELTSAQKRLENAPKDFGGHRVKALAAIKNAVKELELGLEYDKAHD